MAAITNTSVVATQNGPYLRTSNPVVCQPIAAYSQNDKFKHTSAHDEDGNARGNSCTHKSALSVVLSKKSALYDPITESLILIRISCKVVSDPQLGPLLL